MRQVAALRNYHPTVALPNIRMNTSADSYLPIRQMRLVQFDGRSWQPFGAVIETAFTEGAASSDSARVAPTMLPIPILQLSLAARLHLVLDGASETARGGAEAIWNMMRNNEADSIKC